jgi:hypothetical protein
MVSLAFATLLEILPDGANQLNFSAVVPIVRPFGLSKSDARKLRFREAIQRDLGRPVLLEKKFRLSRRANHLH